MEQVVRLSVDGVFFGSLYALAALGISLVFVVQRFANVAQAGLMTAGAYSALAISAAGIPIVFAVPAAVALNAVIAVGIFLLVFKPLRGAPAVVLVIASIGATLVLRSAIGFVWGTGLQSYHLPQQRAMHLGWVSATPTELIGLASTLGAMLGLALLLSRTRLGLEVRAVADVRDLARVSGINSDRVIRWTWALVGALAAVAGTTAGIVSVLTPLLGWNLLLPAFAAAILGGIGRPGGAVAGGFIMGIAGELSTLVLPERYKLVVSFAVMLLVLLIRPSGIFGRRVRI